MTSPKSEPSPESKYIVCRACSDAGGAGRNVEHEPPECKVEPSPSKESLEAARELYALVSAAEKQAGYEEFQEHPPFTNRPEGIEELGARAERLSVAAIASFLDSRERALIQHYEELAKVVEAAQAVTGPAQRRLMQKWPALATLRAALAGPEK